MNKEHSPGFTYGEKDGVQYEIPPGCPNCGPPGNRHCYECYEPVDDITLSSYLDYNDPMAAVLGKCDICGAPAYEDIGPCPACDGPVYEFANSFACYHTFSGNCNFTMTREYVVEQMEELIPRIQMGNLLVSPMCHEEICKNGKSNITYQRIVQSESSWKIETTDYDPEKVQS